MKNSDDIKDLSRKLKLISRKTGGTEKLLSEKELSLEDLNLIKELIDSNGDSVFLFDSHGNFIYMNETGYKTLGYSEEDLMGMNLHELKLSPYERLIEPHIKELIEKGESNFESIHICKDGSPMPVEVTTQIIQYQNKPLILSNVRDISQHKKVENALISAKEQYKAVVNNIGVGIATISPDMEILDLNNQMKEWFPHIDVSRKPSCFKAFNNPPREDVCSYCPTYKTLKDGEVHESITDTPMGDEIINFRIVSSAIKDHEGNVVAAIEMVEDITERKKTEEELKRAYATFNSIFEGPENIIAFSLDSSYQYIFFNQAHSQTMKNIWGVNIEIGKSMLDYISYPEDREKAKNNFDRALSGEKFIELEEYGEETLSRRYWENVYNPIQSGKDIIGLTVFCIDITERQRADERLKENEEKFRAVAESAIDAIITTDSKGIISFFNHSLLKLFGYTASELRCKPVSILIPESLKNDHINGMKSLKSDDLRRTGKTSIVTGLKKDGTEFPFEMSLSSWKSGEDTYFTSIIRDLTERQKAEDTIIRAKEEWERTFNAVPDLIAILDTDYRVIRANKAMADRLGVSPEEAVGATCYEVVHGLDSPPSICPHRKLLVDGQEHTAEVHEDRIGGDFIVSISPLYDSEGKLMGGVHVARDITERKRAEEALKVSEEKYRTIFENVQDVFFQTDIKGKIIEVSPSVEAYFGISPKELIGNHADMLYSDPNDRKKLLKVLQEKGEVLDYEITLQNSAKQPVYISANVHFIYDPKNHPIGIEGALRDITDRKLAEQALKLSQIQLSNAMDLANLANWELDPFKQMFIFNEKFYSMLGTTLEDEGSYSMPIDYYIKKYVHPEDSQFLAEGMKKSLSIRKPTFGTEFEHRIIRRDGETRYVAIHIRVIPATESENAYIYGTVQDITDRKIAEEKLKESLEEKEMLLKEIHHRVKNNLMVISSLLDLQSQYIKDKEALDIFKESQNRANSMALIHERLYRSTDLKKIDFGEYIQSLATDLFRTYVQDPGRVVLNIDVKNEMIDINTTVPLGLIVNELLTNSMKHGFPSGVRGEIYVDFHKEGDIFNLIIGDTGVGFPKDLDFRNTKSLGLQLVNNLTRQIDGEIKLNTDHGTEFEITFEEQYK